MQKMAICRVPTAISPPPSRPKKKKSPKMVKKWYKNDFKAKKKIEIFFEKYFLAPDILIPYKGSTVFLTIFEFFIFLFFVIFCHFFTCSPTLG